MARRFIGALALAHRALAVLITLSRAAARASRSSPARRRRPCHRAGPQRRHDRDRRRAGARLLRLARSCSGFAWGTWMAQLETQPQAFRDVVKNGKVVEVPGAVLTGMPKFEATPVETITYNITPGRGLVRRRADHVRRLPVHRRSAAADRQGPLRPDRLRPTSPRSRAPTPKTAVVKYKPGKTYAGWQSLFASGRHPPVAPPEGQGPRQGAEGRLHVVGRSVVRQVEQGRRRSSSRRTRSTGARSRTSTRSCSSSRPTPPPSSRRSSRARSTRSTRSRSSTSSTRSRRASPARTRSSTRTPGRSKRCGPTCRSSRSTRRPCARRSATRSTAKAIVKKLFGPLGVNGAGELAQPVHPRGLQRPERVGQVQARSRQGRLADDRRRLEEGHRRHLGQGRQEGRVHDHHDLRQQAP